MGSRRHRHFERQFQFRWTCSCFAQLQRLHCVDSTRSLQSTRVRGSTRPINCDFILHLLRILSDIFYASLPRICVTFTYRLKARKFQLQEVAEKMPPDLPVDCTTRLPKTLKRQASFPEGGQSLYRLPSPSSAPLEYAGDDSFTNTVENVRKKLKGKDLQSIGAVLIEVWTREVASEIATTPTLQEEC